MTSGTITIYAHALEETVRQVADAGGHVVYVQDAPREGVGRRITLVVNYPEATS